MSEKISLVAYLYAKPEKEEDVVDIHLSLAPPMRQEAGCIDYHLHRSNEDPLLFNRSSVRAYYGRAFRCTNIDTRVKIQFPNCGLPTVC